MTSTLISDDNTSSQAHDTSTKIKSTTGLRLSKVIFAVFFALGIIFGIQLFFGSIDYHTEQAAKFIDNGFLAAIFPWAITLTRLVIQIMFVSVGTIIFLRKGDDRIAFMTSALLLTFAIGGITYIENTPDPSTYAVEHQIELLWYYGSIAWTLMFSFGILFPDGRFNPRWTAIPLVLALIMVGFWASPSSSPLYPGNWHGLLFLGSHLPLVLLIIYGQVYRYRHISTPIQRQQTKWVLYALGISLLTEVGIGVVTAVFSETFVRGTVSYDLIVLVSDLPYVLLPISLAFAMLRSRLWDIDLIINRSLAYGLVASIGILSFFAIVLGLQVLIGQTQPLVALIIAGAFSVLIFNPLHKRAQNIVDRHIYRFRFNINELHQAHHNTTITHAGALSGKKLGNYQVLDVIGRGGMGEVYKAIDDSKTVAIKTLRTDKVDNDEIVKRFQREAEIGQALHHDNIARVYEINQYEGTVYLVMDYLEGQDLASWLEDHQKLEMGMVREIIRDISSALDYAHEQGFVHRDIKPSNIMLVAKDDKETYRAVLMDFGITKIKNAHSLTGTGAIGTIDYMAPEQIMNAREVDHRADIYALGVVLYEILLGERPFSGGAGQVMFAHIQQPPPDPRDIDPTIPRPIAKAILKALEKSPDDRFDTANEMFVAFA